MKNIKAFTLVEFAVVITIMGLLIGGTLAGIDIIRNSKVTATIAQIDSYNAAVNAFYKTYGALPGDMPDADDRLPNCKKSDDSIFQGCELKEVGGAMTSYVCKTGKDQECLACPDDSFASDTDLCYNYCRNVLANSFCELMDDPTPECRTDWAAIKCLSTSTTRVFPRTGATGLYTATSVATVAYGQVGDGAVGPVSWDMRTYQGQEVVGNTLTADKSIDAETMLFWYELQQAGLISGVTDAALRTDTPKATGFFGKTHPFAELGGGFWAAYSDGVYGQYTGADVKTGRPEGAGRFDLNGNIIVLVKYPTGGKIPTGSVWADICDETGCNLIKRSAYMLNSNPSDNIIDPKEAAYIDRKLDDGLPNTGTIQAYGQSDSCYKPDGNVYVYDEAVSTKYCGLYIKIRE